MNPDIIANAVTFVRKLFAEDYSGHDVFHTLRVYRTAAHIAQQEGADLLTVQLAALLHDADDRKLSPETCAGKDRAVAFLQSQGCDDDRVAEIVRIIDEVSFRGSDSVVPGSIEGKCVQDADRLDAIGAMGIARAFAFGGNHNRAMYDPDIPPVMGMNADAYARSQSTSVNHFYEKLFLLKDMMNTPTARQLAEQRDRFMHEFMDEFMAEWDGAK